MPESDHNSKATACPFCGGEMVRGNIWVSGGGSSSLCWQTGRRLKRGILGRVPDEILIDAGIPVSPAKQAFFCTSCVALLTNFEDSE